MKLLLFISLYLTATGTTESPGIGEIRQLYERSVRDEKTCEKLIGMLEPYNETNNPVYAGYKAGATMIMAKHVFNPFSKFSYFKKGKALLEKAIAKSSSDVELRFLRFTIQTNLPRFLDYHGHISADKAFIIKAFPKVTDTGLRQKITDYVKTSDDLTAAEKKLLLSNGVK
jgi:hypothetical protein